MARGKLEGQHPGRPGGDGFWDRPVLINLLADVLLLAGGVLLAWAGAMALQRLPVFPLRQLVVATPLDQVSRAQIEYTARSALAGNFFTVNLDDGAGRIRAHALGALGHAAPPLAGRRRTEPRGASRRRALDAAGWRGAAGQHARRGLPCQHARSAAGLFTGPGGIGAAGTGALPGIQREPGAIGRKPVAIHLSAREAWQMKLDDGVVLELGRDQPRHPLAETPGPLHDPLPRRQQGAQGPPAGGRRGGHALPQRVRPQGGKS
jgi:cell division protein FtsQ